MSFIFLMPPPVISPSLLIETYLDNVWKQRVPPWKRLGIEALCQYLTRVNFLMYEQYMKTQITMENQPKADWKAVTSNFQKAWVIWFPSRGNNSTGINLWAYLTILTSSILSKLNCMANMCCGLSAHLCCETKGESTWQLGRAWVIYLPRLMSRRRFNILIIWHILKPFICHQIIYGLSLTHTNSLSVMVLREMLVFEMDPHPRQSLVYRL